MSRRSTLSKIYAGELGEDYGDSNVDRAKVLGLVGELRPIFKGECLLCGDQSWRRHPDGCVCGKPYEPERVERPESHGFSAIYLVEVYGG